MCTHKDVDDGHLRAVELVLELEDLMGELDFRRVGYDEVILTGTFDPIYPIYVGKMGLFVTCRRSRNWNLRSRMRQWSCKITAHAPWTWTRSSRASRTSTLAWQHVLGRTRSTGTRRR